MKSLGMKAVLAAAAMCMATLFASGASAHGGVKLEQDECVLKIGPNTMHFIGYQRSGEEQEFCEDIARTGPTVIALTAVSPDLRDMAIGIRVVKDVGEEKEKADISAVTVANYPPKVYHNGTMTFEHNFKDAGHYVGIVTVTDDLGNTWVSRFPFTVGVFTFMAYIEYILYAGAFLVLMGFLYYMLGARARRERALKEEQEAQAAAAGMAWRDGMTA
jgi:hypothetical protein